MWACVQCLGRATMPAVLMEPRARTMGGDSFASRLKRLREAAGLTQGELAERAGMNQFGIAKLEQGVREPTWATVQALAEALGVECTAFVVRGEKAGKPKSR